MIAARFAAGCSAGFGAEFGAGRSAPWWPPLGTPLWAPLWDDEPAMSETLCPRALRAAVFAVACVLLSAVTYAVAGHGSAPLWAVLAAFAVVYPAALAGSGRGRGPAAIAALSVLVQLGLDYWFTLAQLDASAVRGCGLIQALPPMGESISCARTGAPYAVALAPDGAVHVGLGLLLAQLVVALVSALPLCLGERAQLTLCQWLADRAASAPWWPIFALALVRRPAVPAGPDRPAPARPGGQPRPTRVDLRHALARRGPPRAALMAG